MAKLSTHYVGAFGRSLWIQTCLSKPGMKFSADFNDEQANLIGEEVKQVGSYSSYKELCDVLDEIIKASEQRQLKAKSKPEKMIFYDIILKGEFDYKLNGKKKKFKNTDRHNYGRVEELSIEVRPHQIVERRRFGKLTEYKTLEGEIVSPGYDQAMIEWTPDRQAFFENFETGIKALIVRFNHFFAKHKRKTLLDAMDSKQLVLNGPETKEEENNG